MVSPYVILDLISLFLIILSGVLAIIWQVSWEVFLFIIAIDCLTVMMMVARRCIY